MKVLKVFQGLKGEIASEEEKWFGFSVDVRILTFS
jgi:hypothetical protein